MKNREKVSILAIFWYIFKDVYGNVNLVKSNCKCPFCHIFLLLVDLNNSIVWWSRFILRFPTLPAPLSSLWGPFRVRLLQLVSPSPSCSMAFLVLWQGLSNCLPFSFIWFSLAATKERQSPLRPDQVISYYYYYFPSMRVFF